MSTCVARPAFFGIRRDDCCGEPAVVDAAAACVHEHIRRLLVCQDHLDQARDGRTICMPCLDADGHECRLTLGTVEALPDTTRSA